MMKKFIGCLILFILASIAGCGSGGNEFSVPAASNNEGNTVITPSVNFVAQYVRTNGYHSEASYPASTVINSLSELDDYINKNKGNYDLESDFLRAADRYDEAYFADKMLVLVLLEEGSGSISHTVTGVTQNEREILVTIKRHLPGEGVDGTCDMAQWHIMIELKKDAYSDKPVTVKFE